MDAQVVERTRAALEANGFGVTSVDRRDDVAPFLKGQLAKGATCAVGGSMSLFECGVIDLLRSGDYAFLDRYQEGVDVKDIYRRSFAVENYFASANALTEKGELMFIDGNGNRAAAVMYGPDRVWLVVSVGKICPDLKAAGLRCKTVACPKNARRLHLNTACAATGRCLDTSFTEEGLFCRGQLKCPGTICDNTLVISRCRFPGRIHVILVGEECGY